MNKLNIIVGKIKDGKTTYLLKEIQNTSRDKTGIVFSSDIRSRTDIAYFKLPDSHKDILLYDITVNIDLIETYIEVHKKETGAYPEIIYIDNLEYYVGYNKDISFKEQLDKLLIKLHSMTHMYNCEIYCTLSENMRKDHNRKLPVPCTITKVHIDKENILYKNSYDNYTGKGLGKCSWKIREEN